MRTSKLLFALKIGGVILQVVWKISWGIIVAAGKLAAAIVIAINRSLAKQ